MSQLVAYYDDAPLRLRSNIEVHQDPIEQARGERSSDGVIRPAVIYVVVQGETGVLHVPFAEYDEWSLRDRYNEAIRIMNTLGAATITCESFREVTARRGIKARVLKRTGASLTQVRLENDGYDFRHTGTGSAARDPRPLRWPDEPGFAAAVSSVLDNGATEVTINIKSNRTHSTEGSLGLELKRIGFELGGHSQNSGATSLHIKAEFRQSGWNRRR